MKIKTLLLGSAAVLSAVGAAQAADTTPAPAPARPAAVVAAPAVKPVAYVTVCDAFGLGYFYIPGQMATCFRLQGQIQFSINFHTRDTGGPWATTTSPHEAVPTTTAASERRPTRVRIRICFILMTLS